ncbi:MAG: hypothetical protein HY000_35255 [Planctomycetes bacterium]|nr:hypothetical protein [Planctomycetota bacterium]
MKTITCWDDLCPYGIEALTGESCGLSYRILCDVTTRGKSVLQKMLGITELVLAENWNRATEEEPHIGSVMLAPEILTPVAVFALLESGCTEAWSVERAGIVGIEPIDSPAEIEALKRHYAERLGRRFGYFGTAGDRNRHVMTGRVQ